ncbi:hypothetical protein JW926_06890, partial [Candidatus Sumerlaeota bacterium]|nr:hypothetical protein [Candidatus Sumerlaeota bacterium]
QQPPSQLPMTSASPGASPFGATTTGKAPFGSPSAAPATNAPSPFGVTQQPPSQPPMTSASLAGDSPIAATGQTPGIDSPLQTSSAAGTTVKKNMFSEGMPPLNISGNTGVASPASQKPYGNYYETLDDGKKAIQDLNKPGFVYLTNPQDEDNQRVERILELGEFRNVLSGMVFIKLDVDKNPKMLSHYGIHKTPSVILYDSSGLMRKKIQSVSDMSYLLQELKMLQ